MTLSTTDDARLLDHYIHRGHGPWNVSLEASYLDYELRRVLVEQLPAIRARVDRAIAPTHRPLRVCNVGIGVGLWDDWLGHLVGARITCVDRDPEICDMFALRQQRERHPFPARVICGDVLAGALDEMVADEHGAAGGGPRFDLITCIGSTLGESGDPPGLRQAMRAALAPHGVLFVAEVRESAGMPGVALACTFTSTDGRSMTQV